MSFYRTYRPQTLDEIDNAAVSKQLATLLNKKTEDLPHAYLFYGPRGAGKTTAARLVAKIFNCTKRKADEGPCGTCESCESIAKGNNIDVIEIDAASNRGIDEMRQLRERIGYTPTHSKFTVYIIDEVHMLTTEAFNALLKTLEEPPAHAVFILATTELAKVLPTIRSRCMTISFAQAGTQELCAALNRIVKKEKLTIDEDAITEIAKSADGSFRDAVKYLEQISLSSTKITRALVQEILTLSDDSTLRQFLKALSLHDGKQAIEIIGEIEQKGSDVRVFVRDILKALQDKLVDSIKGTDDKDFSIPALTSCISVFTKAWGDIKISPIPSLPVEIAIIEYTKTAHVTRITEEKHIEDKPAQTQKPTHVPDEVKIQPAAVEEEVQSISGTLTTEKLIDCWKDVIEAFKPYNHSIAGVLRSARPKSVSNGIVTIEAFYAFHKEKLSEPKTKEVMSSVFKKLFGEKVRIDVIVGKK
jgi:DNA polymerase III subunit gamma/tau